VAELRTCEVSYRDTQGIRHSVEVTAQTLYKAAALGSTALRVSSIHHVTFEVKIKQPEVTQTISGAVLAAWLARPGKDAAEQALKERLDKLMRGEPS
jgi:uncharacterized protein YraI